MSMLSRLLKQTGTYWGSPVRNRYGDATFAAPVSVACRYEDKSELFIDQITGDQVQSRAVAYLSATIEPGGFLYLGTSVTTTPKTVTGADQIRRVEKCPDIKGGRVNLFKVYL